MINLFLENVKKKVFPKTKKILISCFFGMQCPVQAFFAVCEKNSRIIRKIPFFLGPNKAPYRPFASCRPNLLPDLYLTQKNSTSSPTGPMQKAMRAGYGGSEGMQMSFGSIVIA